jgi:hypothetical protein
MREIVLIGAIALHRLPAYWSNMNVVSTGIGPLLLLA